MMATAHTTPSIFFAKVPDFKDLCSITLNVCDSLSQSGGGDRNSTKYVGSQPQIIKCRELIFTEPMILASPSLQQEQNIYVILQQSLWKSGRLQARCQKMGLQVSKPMRVISPVFQACLAYTIRAKLAPLWNKAGTCYLQGRDFLVGSGHMAAIDMELNVTETEICLALRPMMAKLPRCTIADFEVCRPVVEQFFQSNNNVILEYSIENKWCYVLPSLKKGKVVSISHEIPATSPFKTYKDIRRYWKNAYGYRLPDSSAGVMYYNIYFPAIGPTLFTYPEYCIRKQETTLQTRVDPAPIINAFIADLRYKLPSVCSAAFEVTPKAQFTNTGLYQSGQKEGCLSDLSLSSTPPPTSVRRIPTRQLTFQGSLSPNRFTSSCTVPGAPHPIITPSRLPANLPSPVGDLNGMFSVTNPTQPTGSFPPRAPYGDMQYTMPQNTLCSQPMGAAQRNIHSFRPIIQYGSPHQIQPSYQATASQGTRFKPVQQNNSVNCQVTSPHQIQPSYQATASQGTRFKPILQNNSANSQVTSPHQIQPSYQATASQGTRFKPVLQNNSANSQVTSPHQIQPSYQATASQGTRFKPVLQNNSANCQVTSPHQVQPSYQATASQGTRFKPVLQNNSANCHIPCNNTYINDIYARSPPVTNTALCSSLTNTSYIPQTNLSPNQIIQVVSPISQRIVPRFLPKHPQIKYTSNTSNNIQQNARVVPKFTPIKRANIQPRRPTGVSAFTTESNPPISTDDATFPEKAQQIAVTGLNLGVSKTAITPSFRRKELSHTSNLTPQVKRTQQTLDALIRKKSETPKPNQGGGKSVKRKPKEDGVEVQTASKKPRNKPKLQEGIDITSLAVNDQLSKVNTITLATWLKDKGIGIKSKDKKADLIQRVMEYIHLNSTED
ncbi:uncharacterized protein [Asterias amurensis]|uniref:uncharacterized protein n=1 Tax=Asterias amurensis TaxID=7602 RepID=UPI003AB3E459